jgi:hypothetical protein
LADVLAPVNFACIFDQANSFVKIIITILSK